MQGTTTQNAAAILFSLFVVAGIAVKLWAMSAALEISGPRVVDVAPNDVFVVIDHDLYQLSHTGVMGNVVPIAELGLDGPIVAVQGLAAGEVLLGDLRSRSIFRCTLESRDCERVAPSDRFAIDGQFGFRFEEHSGRLYITDTNRHRLLVQDVTTAVLSEVRTPDRLRLPSGIAIDMNGRAVVADTNNHRTVVLEVDDTGTSIAEDRYREISAKTAIARSGHHWPIAVAVDGDERIWTLNGNSALARADLIGYADTVPVRRGELPAHADPVSVAARGSLLVVADPFMIGLHEVDVRSGVVLPFGDASFQALLAERRDRKRRLERYGNHGLSLLIVGLVLAGLLLVTVVRGNHKNRTSRSGTVLSRAAIANVHDVVWAQHNPDVRRPLRLIMVASIGVFVLCALLIAYIAYEALRDGASWTDLAELGMGLAAAILLVGGMSGVSWWLLTRLMGANVGSDGENLYLRDHRGRVLRVAPEDVIHTPRIVAYRSTAVTLQFGTYGPAFEPESFYRDIYPYIARGRRVSELHLLAYQLVHGHAMTWSVLAATVVLLGAYVYLM
jgi:hypothetical protein